MESEQAATAASTTRLSPFKYSNRVLLKTILERRDGGLELIGERVVIGGWPVPHIAGDYVSGEPEPRSDVSCIEILQSRIPFLRTIVNVLGGGSGDHYPHTDKLETSIHKSPPPSTVFLKVGDGSCVASLQVVIESSLAPPCQLLHTGTCIIVEGLLQKSLVQSVMRIRNALEFAAHTFCQNHGFLSKAVVEIDGVSIDELKRTDSNKEAVAAATQDLKKANELASQCEAREKSKPKTSQKVDNVKSSEGYFSSPTYLTSSGRMHLEATLAPLEMCTHSGHDFKQGKESPQNEAINCAGDFLKSLCKWVVENCSEDMKFLSQRIDKTRTERLQSMVLSTFERVSYTEALDALKKVTEKTKDTKIEWGAALTEADLRYLLADEIYKKPVIVYNYPKETKPFYAGRLISGSQNEGASTF
ncbi:asparagine--tRNA ligase [Pyrus ussuriensis x Pyrus communis]|uniref:Asparagine--tRNA ligase n=1 Tax=Pyrus ussuriensis x Pyrus communis TaxID=2448454 RepID=A0A5N5IIB8_9ROSA|nr:asparagine--tRNA ligase [Pyrus ussuriensis x Pyrus communis]